jgi:CheY-like chemotaxis protein
MNLKSQVSVLKNESRDLTRTERAEVSCRLVKQFEKAGDYQAAYEAIAEFWPDPTAPPKVDDLDNPTQAEILLCVGGLAGWLGSANHTAGSQETAKNLITKAIEIFEELGRAEAVAEAHADLALCYWREGALDEARINLNNALAALTDDSDLKATILIRTGMVEVDRQRLDQALRLYSEASPLVEQSEDHALKGSFHIEYGLLLRRLATPENREDYLDQALIEYAAASYHFEQAGNDRYLARVENNLGFLYYTIGRHKDAHSHLDRARHLFLKLRDIGTAAQVDDTRARTLLAQGHMLEAERLARAAVRVLERGDQQAILAEALTTHGIVLARLGHHQRSKALLERAIDIAETTGDLEGAGRAKLSIIEELGDKFPAKELVSVYRSAIELLKNSQDPSTATRLIACAERLIDLLVAMDTRAPMPADQEWEGFSLKKFVRDEEKAIIERALRDAEGSVSKAARMLGFKHHQSLISLLSTRHKDLMKARSTVRKRRRHLFSGPTKAGKTSPRTTRPRPASQLSVLHVEDQELVARTVSEILTNEGMRVDSCINGSTALKLLKGETPYDLIIVDNSLPGLDGLELVTRARNIGHRRTTPIIMLSSDDLEREAWRAGVDAFLLKPEAIDQISSTVRRLLEERKSRPN